MVRVTPGHMIWSADRRGWVGAHELLPGESIRVAGNAVAPVEGVRRVPGMIEVFGIEVEYFHNYFVGTGDNAMLVHNGPPCFRKPLTPSQAQKGIGSLEKRVVEHQKKLADYIKNPEAFDNKGFLKNAPTPEIRQQIIDGRVNHLQGEIGNFLKQIEALKGLLGGG